jgi:hypothetical protein
MLLAEITRPTVSGASRPERCLSTWEVDALEVHMQSRLNGRVRNLRLVCRETGLIIQGHAFSYYVKQLAQHAVMEATSVPVLSNDIVVE